MDTTITKEEIITLFKKVCMEQCNDGYDDYCEEDNINCAMKHLIHALDLQDELNIKDGDERGEQNE